MDRLPGRAGDATLSAGELRRIVFYAMAHADAFQRFVHALLRWRWASTLGERQLHVFVNRQIANQVERLKMNPISRLRIRARS
jgi:hypothetical protein